MCVSLISCACQIFPNKLYQIIKPAAFLLLWLILKVDSVIFIIIIVVVVVVVLAIIIVLNLLLLLLLSLLLFLL